MPAITEALAQLGLNDKETKVYLACLELGGASVHEVADKAGVKRTSIYNFLEELKTKGLVSEIKQNNRTLLIPEDPHALVANRREEIKKTEGQIKNLEEIIPNLMSIYNVPGNKAKIKYYQGIEGLKKVYRDTLIPGSTLYGFIDIDKCFAAMGDWILEYVDERLKLNMDYQVIGNHGAWENDPRIDNKKQKRNIKFASNVKFDTEIDIYANKVAIYSFREPYAGVIIEDQAIHQTMKSIWKLLWENLPDDLEKNKK